MSSVCAIRIQRTFRSRCLPDAGVPLVLRGHMRAGYNPFTGRLRGAALGRSTSLMEDVPINRRPRAMRTILDNIAQVRGCRCCCCLLLPAAACCCVLLLPLHPAAAPPHECACGSGPLCRRSR